jgi:D-glycero-D-manno-heptose 1,7-bisphosphate phosphatase
MAGPAHGLKPAVFLDRDGVIVIPEFRDRRSFAPRRVEDFRLYPEAAAALRRLKQAGFALAVVTNQPDVGHGLIARADVEAMHEIVARELPVDAIKSCYHRQTDNCDCRKPKAGMLLAAADELGVDLGRSFMVGDRGSDVEAGRAVGCATVFIDLDYDEPRPDAPDFVVRSVAEAADVIIEATFALSKPL